MKNRMLFGIIACASVMALVSCSGKKANKITIATPDGAPAVALQDLYGEKEYSITNGIDPSEELKTLFADGSYDVIMAPVNLGANLYNNKESSYVLSSVLTWGNLYIASQSPIDEASLSGKTVKAFGKTSINSVIINDVMPEDTTVSYDYDSTADSAEALLKSDTDIVVVAEPKLSVVTLQLKAKNITVNKISIQELYSKKHENRTSFPQAGCFIREDIKNSKKIRDFLADLKESCDECTNDLDEVSNTVVNIGLLPNVNVAKMAIPGSNISYKTGKEAKADIDAICDLNKAMFGGANPQDEFYL